MPSAYPPPKSDARLLLISNRLPITIKRSEDGSYDFSMSSGGLVSGLSGLSKSTTFQWYGWPGLEVPEKEAGPLTKRLKDEYNAVPVFIDDELADRHYNGFSSKEFLSHNRRLNSANSTDRFYPLASFPLPSW
jgi:trehalose 6-phosphate synthase